MGGGSRGSKYDSIEERWHGTIYSQIHYKLSFLFFMSFFFPSFPLPFPFLSPSLPSPPLPFCYFVISWFSSYCSKNVGVLNREFAWAKRWLGSVEFGKTLFFISVLSPSGKYKTKTNQPTKQTNKNTRERERERRKERRKEKMNNYLLRNTTFYCSYISVSAVSQRLKTLGKRMIYF